MDRGRDPSWRAPSPPASRYRDEPYDAPRDDHPRRGYGSPDRRGGGGGGAGRRGGYDGGRGGYDGGRGGYDGGRGPPSPPSRYRDDPYDGGRERRYRDDRYESGGRDDHGASRRDYDRSRYDDRGGGGGGGGGPPGRYRDDYAGQRRGYDGNRRGGYEDRGGGGGGGRGMAMSDRPRRPPPDISDLYSLLVLNVTFRTRSAELRPLFQKYGEVRDCYIPRSRDTGDSRGFAFVRYSKREEAEAAIEHVNNAVVDGREIIVQFAKFGRQDAVNQAAAMGVPAAEVETTTAARAGPADGDEPMASNRDDGPLPSRDDGRDEAVESRKRQLSRSPSPDRADRRSRSPEVKRARSRSPERGSKMEREGGHDPVARSGSDDEGGRSHRDD